MSNGAEQFLGRQLVNMTQALQGLVADNVDMLLALQDMKTAIESSIPKFSIASNNVRKTETVLAGTPYITTSPKRIIPFFSGVLRLKITKRSAYANEKIVVKVNGVQVNTSIAIPFIYDLNINEKDIIEVYIETTAVVHILDKIEVCYDLINKPDISM